jgi:hypothetical protein
VSQQIAKAESASVIQAFQTDLATIHAAMSTNIGAGGLSEFDLPRIKIPAGGGLQWAVPTLEGETIESAIEGVIVLARDTRAYYSQPIGESGGNQPPDCSSPDGTFGIGTPGGNCMSCPLTRYGSAPTGRGQACKQIKQVFMLRGSLLLPEVITLPPTSLKGAKQYLLKLTSQGIPYYSVVTRVGLERTKNSQGIAYSKATFTFVRRLTPDEVKKALEYHEMLKPLVQKMLVDVDASEVQEDPQ